MQNDEGLLTKVAYMYYIDNLPQSEIASILKISRSSVSRLLQSCRDKGIVKIEINPTNARCFHLEKQLKEKYRIEDAIVIPSYSTKTENILKSLGKAGAKYLEQILEENMTINISMGRTLNEVINYLNFEEKINCNVVPITGGLGQVKPEYHSNDICRRAAEKIGGVAQALYAPSIVSSESLKNGIVEDVMIQQVFELAQKADITLVGVGSIESSTFLDIGTLTKEETEEMKKAGVVGDIGAWFFDRKGKILDLEIQKRVVGPDFRELAQTSKVILIAGTEYKKEVIKAALLGDWTDILVTDESVANFLLS